MKYHILCLNRYPSYVCLLHTHYVARYVIFPLTLGLDQATNCGLKATETISNAPPTGIMSIELKYSLPFALSSQPTDPYSFHQAFI